MFNSLDQQTDFSNKELYTFLTNTSVPEFVKNASLEEVKEVGDLQKEAFADPIGRNFPINTPARVYVSNAFFINKRAALGELRGDLYVQTVESKIKEAAGILDITDVIEEYNKVAEARNNLVYEDKTVTIKIAQDEIDLFTIKTAQDLDNASNTFVENINKYPFEWRRNISESFVKAAEDLNVDELPALVLKYAGQYYPDVVAIKAEITRRMTKVSAENQTRYQKLIGDVNNITDKEEVFKLAECLHYTEKKAGLYDKAHYRKILGDPVDKLFTMHLDKVASELDVITMGGEKFASADLQNISSDVYEQAFGIQLDPKSAEAKDILPTMPRSDVDLFKHLSGVRPI